MIVFTKETCQSCKFWNGEYGPPNDIINERGKCQRHSPVQGYIDEHHIGTVWPWTRNGDWCGDYEMVVILAKEEAGR